MSENSQIGKICWIDMPVDDANGGEVLVGPRGLAGGRFCVIKDPSGAVAALYQP